MKPGNEDGKHTRAVYFGLDRERTWYFRFSFFLDHNTD